MSRCRDSEELIRRLVAGELEPSGTRRLEEHARTCDICRAVLEAHRTLEHDAGTVRDAADPIESTLGTMRTGVLAELARRRLDAARPGFRAQLGALLRGQPVATALAMLLVLAVGVAGGRWSAGDGASGSGGIGDGVVVDPLLQAIARQASTSAGDGLEEYWDAPLIYTNVTARPTDAGRLALSFDVSRHVEVETGRESAVARDVLLQAILDPSPLGSRLRAMQLGQQTLDPRLREAVIFTLHNDPSLAVRRQALAVLGRYPFDEVVRQALVRTLREDVTVQMRLDALDLLARHAGDPDALRRALENAAVEGDAAVEQRAVELMQQL